ncbi:hypothetical protein HOY80DRAFT_1086208 [Tuber brumale]|nr:hypothetical protein HOY80DRAFT_1086208 [Tuber brumale]
MKIKPPLEEYLQPGQTLHHFSPLKTLAQEALYPHLTQQIKYPDAVGAEEGGGRGEDLRADGSPGLCRTPTLTYVSQFASYQIRLMPLFKHRAESVIADVVALHLGNSAHVTLGGPNSQFSPMYARKRSKHQLTIPLNPTHSRMSGLDPDMFLTAVARGCICRARGEGVGKRVSLSFTGGEAEVWKHVFLRELGTNQLDPDRKALPVASERSGLWAVVIAGSTARREKVPKLWDDDLFIG